MFLENRNFLKKIKSNKKKKMKSNFNTKIFTVGVFFLCAGILLVSFALFLKENTLKALDGTAALLQ